MAKPHRMFLVIALGLAMCALPIDWRPRAGTEGPGLPSFVLWAISLGCVITMWRRLARATSLLAKESA